jgi:multimeric flavodoxin WrbA
MHAPAKSNIPIADAATLEKYDAFLFGIPTRYGNFPAQWKAFWDTTGKQWASGAYWGKYAGVFVSTGTPGGGQETTVINALSTLAHHGFIYVPLGYKTAFPILANLSEVRGGSPWGAGTYAVSWFVPLRTSYVSYSVSLGWRWIPPTNSSGNRACNRPRRGFCHGYQEGQLLS